MNPQRWAPRLLLGLTLLAGATQFTLPLLRPGAVFAFLLLCPGAALVGLLNWGSVLTYWVLSVATSLALAVLMAEGAVLTGTWALETSFWLLFVTSVVGFGLQLWWVRSLRGEGGLHA